MDLNFIINNKAISLKSILSNLGIGIIILFTVFVAKAQPCIIGNPSAISGSSTGICFSGINNPTYSIEVVNGATTYDWTVPFGVNVVSGQGTNSITLDITSDFTTGILSVVASNDCASAPTRSLTIRSVPLSPGTISGNTSGLCVNGINNPSYSITNVAGATSYVWTVPTGTTIISGQGTTSATLDISNNFLNGALTVAASNDCGSSPIRSITIRSAVPLIPGSISGITTGLCENGINNPTYSISTVSGATSYVWSAPIGTTIVSGQGTTSVTLNISGSFISGALTVVAMNECGSSPIRTITLRSAVPLTPGSISGIITGLCENGINNPSYSIVAVSNATNYSWTAPAGTTIISGQGTTSVTLNVTNSFTSGALTVVASNFCGSSSSRSITLRSAVPSTPGSISGITTGLCSSGVTTPTYSIVGIMGATNYVWTAPVGTTIISGQGTTSITLNISNGFTSGLLTVAATNDCGSSLLRSMSLSSSLLIPTSIIGSTTPCGTESYNCPSVTNANSYIWAVPNGMEIISGQGTTSITVNVIGSSISGNVSVRASSNCRTGGSKALAVNTCSLTTRASEPFYMQTTNEVATEIDAIVYPNPVNDNLNILFAKEFEEEVYIEINDFLGKTILRNEIKPGTTFVNITLEGMTHGVYLLKAFNPNGVLIYTTKLLKQE